MEQENQRYARHYSLKDFGVQGQEKLAAARVLVIGAGGLGCPVLQYLTAAGIGTIGIVDHDTVSISNLQRQVLFTTADIGKFKSKVAETRLRALNPEINIKSFAEPITTLNALGLMADYDVVVDCTDNFAARYLINDACVLLNKPLVFGAIFQYEGQVAVFNVANANNKKANYRHLFPTPPNPLEVKDCNEAGVLGVLPGIIGTLQATEVIKLITGIGELLAGRLLTFNLLNYQSYTFEIATNTSLNGLLPFDEAAFKAVNYEWLCGIKAEGVNELSVSEFLSVSGQPDTVIIDVRESHEQPKPDVNYVGFPLSKLMEIVPDIKENNIVLFCQSGKRSLKAAQFFLDKYKGQKNISHLTGGILALQKITHEQKY